MKLKTFDASTLKTRRSSNPEIHLAKPGTIRFNPALVDTLSLAPGDSVIFHQDELRKKDWYIEKVKINGFNLRKCYGEKNKSLLINAAMLCEAMRESLGQNYPISLPVCTVTTEGKYYAILTSIPKQ